MIKHLGCFNPFTQKKLSSSTINLTNLTYSFSYQDHAHLPINFHKKLCLLSYEHK